jgi:hypothetical protein
VGTLQDWGRDTEPSPHTNFPQPKREKPCREVTFGILYFPIIGRRELPSSHHALRQIKKERLRSDHRRGRMEFNSGLPEVPPAPPFSPQGKLLLP